jgi:phosphoribosyl 1,2-cyclic phosphate phosphodiesterase
VKIRILGCGTSSGVPRIGNDWGACDPTDPRNRRLRQSAIVSTATTRILIDTGPDLREQLLAADVETVDAVIWTHAHADHCHGIDDLRQMMHALGRPVRGLARPFAAEQIVTRFDYIFHGRAGYRPSATMDVLPDRLTIGDIDIAVVDQPHGNITSAGLRFSDPDGRSIGYSTDCHDLTDAMAATFADVDLWVVDALRREPHPTHAHLQQTLGWIDRCRAARAVLIHLDHSMDYATLARELPDGVIPGHDGLELAI